MDNKPVVLVTRRLPAAVEQKLGERFTTLLNPEDRLYSSAELLNSQRRRMPYCPATRKNSRQKPSRNYPHGLRPLPISRSVSTTSTSKRKA